MLGPALDVVASMIPRIEAERRLPREVVDAFVTAGTFKLMVPRAYGGADASIREAIEVIEAISRVDGSAGWCANITMLSGTMAHFLDEATARGLRTGGRDYVRRVRPDGHGGPRG
jgi:alkylation response protein AidB-like acyl-CoA dehydrogenase